MTQLLFPLLLGGGLTWYLFRTVPEKKDRGVGMILILLGSVCFALYAYGILGVGLSSFIVNLFGKAGVAS